MMKDRYLFKAKRVDSGEWMQGYLYGIWEKRYILWGMTNDIPNMIEVDPPTICQCTGMKDKNGNLIWENDIMVAHLDDDYPEDETYIRIMWHGSGICSKENGSEDIIPIGKFEREHFEVCGNIFDNPDLLEMEV
nr:MAG TPA: YopX protein [Caudoviricetes sp.]